MRFVFIPLVIAVVTVVAALLLAVPSQPMPYLSELHSGPTSTAQAVTIDPYLHPQFSPRGF
jgi:hypothetical protein